MLAAARVFVLACVPDKEGGSDNLPTVIMEAMFAQVPVISTHLDGVPEMIENDKNGLLVPPGNPAAIAEAVARLLADLVCAEGLGRQGRAPAWKKFAVENTASKLKHLLVKQAGIRVPEAARKSDPTLPAPGFLARLGRFFDK